MKKTLLFVGAIMLVIMIIFVKFFGSEKIFSPLGKGPVINNKNLGQYTYTALHKTTFSGSQITIDKALVDGDGFSSYVFYFYAEGKKVSGLMTIPKKSGTYKLIILIRGYVDPKVYQPGIGTEHDGEYLAQNGFITLAPDFLGYGSSDKASTDAMEDRFLTYVTVMELLSSTKNLNAALANTSLSVRYDNVNIGIWGHSNGGQIALSILEISGKNYPTVLWAPVSKPFPYSILYYTDDIDDHGKALRKVVSDFEVNYNSENYSLANYFDWIKAPMQIDQGQADEDVPLKWSDILVDTLKKKGKDVEYFTYPGEDHNFDQGSWSLAIQRTLAFYKKQFNLKNE